jgi:tetratricopeptide (TPR) repeat protein
MKPEMPQVDPARVNQAPNLPTGANWVKWIQKFVCAACLGLGTATGSSATADSLFQDGSSAYRMAEYERASAAFQQSIDLQPASGTLQNLGNAEWQRGNTGRALLAWERALWLDPFKDATRQNLRYARHVAQLETPQLTWYEVVSTWLPMNWWAWIAGVTFWFSLGLATLPGILRYRKATWQQALASFGLMLFLLSAPAHWGVHTRSRIGFIIEKNTPLRLTPTEDAQVVTRLPAGETARLERTRGRHLLIRTIHGMGWVEESQFGLLCPRI